MYFLVRRCHKFLIITTLRLKFDGCSILMSHLTYLKIQVRSNHENLGET